MQDLFRGLCLLPLAAVLAACGGGSDSGASGVSGPTHFSGVWTLVATLNVNLGGTETIFTDTSEVVVAPNGGTVIRQTDSDCGLNITVNGDMLTYIAQCTFPATSGDTAVACTLELVSRARITGTPGTTSLSGTFGSKTEVCRGVAASYTGNLVGNRRGIDDDINTSGDRDTENEDTT